MHTGYKGYKSIASNTMYAYIATGYKGYKSIASDTIIICIQVTRVTCKLQATQYIMHTGYNGYKPIITSNTMYIMHAGYKGYMPIANNTICDLTLEN